MHMSWYVASLGQNLMSDQRKRKCLADNCRERGKCLAGACASACKCPASVQPCRGSGAALRGRRGLDERPRDLRDALALPVAQALPICADMVPRRLAHELVRRRRRRVEALRDHRPMSSRLELNPRGLARPESVDREAREQAASSTRACLAASATVVV